MFGIIHIWRPLNFLTLGPPSPLSAFDTDMQYRIHATSFTYIFFWWSPSPPSNVDVIWAWFLFLQRHVSETRCISGKREIFKDFAFTQVQKGVNHSWISSYSTTKTGVRKYRVSQNAVRHGLDWLDIWSSDIWLQNPSQLTPNLGPDGKPCR